MATAPVVVDIPPGVLKTVSVLAAKGRWIDADKVRFVNAKPEKWGGWTRYVATQLDGLVRGAYGWTTSGKESVLSMGTWRKFYTMYGTTADPVDITPITASGTLANNPFTTTNGQPTVNVLSTAHTRIAGAIVHFSGATAVGGITVNGPYVVTSVTDANNFVITAAGNASSGATGGGAAVAYSYELNPGQTDTIYGTGWGAGTYGTGTYGTPRSVATLLLEMRYWSITNYGNELLFCPGDDTIFLWDEPDSATNGAALANAPATVRYAFVTNERYVMALGTPGNAMQVAWPDVNDPTNWTPALNNTADIRTLQDGNKLMAGCVWNDTVNLIWSDTALYVAQYLPGVAFIYDIATVSTPAGLVGQGAFCTTPMGVFWLSGNDMMLYNGTAAPVPNFDDMRDWFFRDFNRAKAHKAIMTYNALKNEVQVHYASQMGNGENDSYVACSLDTMSWVNGRMAGNDGHTAMCVRRDPTREIFAAHADGYVYQHETSTDANGAAMAAYIESGIVGIGDGASDMDVIGYEPNFERQTGDILLEVDAYDRPRGEQLGTPADTFSTNIAETDALIDMLIGGRYVKHRLTSDVMGGDFRLGLGIFEAGPGGSSR